MVKISVSVLNSHNMKEDIEKLNQTDVDYLHMDIMDGKFVCHKTASFAQLKKSLTNNSKPLDVHLMVENPDRYIDDYALLNTEYITVHKEIKNLGKYLDKIKNYGLKCGISIKPSTSIEEVFSLLDQVDLVLIMSVEPGAGGQDFLESSLEKVTKLKAEIKRKNKPIVIEIDGGINNTNKDRCIETGVDILVSGTYIIQNEPYQKRIDDLRA